METQTDVSMFGDSREILSIQRELRDISSTIAVQLSAQLELVAGKAGRERDHRHGARERLAHVEGREHRHDMRSDRCQRVCADALLLVRC